MHIQNGEIQEWDMNDFVEPESASEMPSDEDLLKLFENRDQDRGILGQQIRNLSQLVTNGSSQGFAFVKWLAIIMRKVMHDDIEDYISDNEKAAGIFLDHFSIIILIQVQDPHTPNNIQEILTKLPIRLLLNLLCFEKTLNGFILFNVLRLLEIPG